MAALNRRGIILSLLSDMVASLRKWRFAPASDTGQAGNFHIS